MVLVVTWLTMALVRTLGCPWFWLERLAVHGSGWDIWLSIALVGTLGHLALDANCLALVLMLGPLPLGSTGNVLKLFFTVVNTAMQPPSPQIVF